MIIRQLRTLEQEGMVNSRNDYQEIVNAIAKVYTLCVSCYTAVRRCNFFIQRLFHVLILSIALLQ